MKKLLVVFALSLFITAPSMAIVSPSISFLSADQIMSKVLPQGKIDVSAKIEYWNPNEEYLGNTDLFMEPIANDHLTFTVLSIPLRISYGVTDNMSLRFSTQYVKYSMVETDISPSNWEGSGLGDSKIEMLYQVAKETANNPSIAVNVGADILSGVNYIELPKNASDTSLATGTYAPRYYLSGIFGKKYGVWDGMAMIGYIMQDADRFGRDAWIPANEIIYSVCMSTTAGGGLKYGGELSGIFAGENINDYTGLTDNTVQGRTPITKVSVTPFVTYQQSEDISYKACLEIPLSMRGTTSSTNMDMYRYRGINISLGVNWAI